MQILFLSLSILLTNLDRLIPERQGKTFYWSG